MQAEMLLRELERPLRRCLCELELTAVNGDPCDWESVLRHLDPVLNGNVPRSGSEVGGQLPASCLPFEHRQRPQRPRAPELVAVPGPFVCVLCASTRRLDVVAEEERALDSRSRPVFELGVPEVPGELE